MEGTSFETSKNINRLLCLCMKKLIGQCDTEMIGNGSHGLLMEDGRSLIVLAIVFFVQKDMKLVPYKSVNKDGKPYIGVKIKDGEPKVFSPKEVSAMILIKMETVRHSLVRKSIKDVVVTVPGE
ncbi:hypothetical protein CsSME_00050645 [Camellia sinensis var. sinensis]